jgi:hypothetical protein
LRSPGVSSIIGGNLLDYQQQPKTNGLAESNSLTISSSQVNNWGHYRFKSKNSAGISKKNIRPQSAKGVPCDPKKLDVHRYDKDLIKTSYMDSFCDPESRRLSSAIPIEPKYSFAYLKDKDQLEPATSRLLKEYRSQRVHKSAFKAYNKQEKPIKEAEIKQEQKPLESDIKELQVPEQLIDIPASESEEVESPRTPVKQEEPQIVVDELTSEKVDELTPEKVDELTPEKVDELTPEKVDELAPEKVDELTPDKVDNKLEFKLRYKLREKLKTENQLRGKLDMELSNNYLEQSKLNSKISKLKDQQKERDFSHNADLIAQQDKYQKQTVKSDYGTYAKKDINKFLSKKDQKKKAYAKDMSNYKGTLKKRKQLIDDEINMTAYYKHLQRKDKFMSRSMVETSGEKTPDWL